MIKKAILPVAGLGTRFLPASKSIPKEMVTVVDRPAIEYVVREAVTAGIEQIILITHSSKGAIEDYFDRNFELETSLIEKRKDDLLQQITEIIPKEISIISVRQTQPLGLGHAVLCAKNLIADDPFAVLLPDVLIKQKEKQSDLEKMIENYKKTQAAQIMVELVDESLVDHYGIVDVEYLPLEGQSVSVSGIIEKPPRGTAPSNLAVVGRYILPATVMQLLEKTPRGAGNEIQLTDAIAMLQQHQAIEAYRMQGQSFDCGSKLGYLKAMLHYGIDHVTLGNDFKAMIKTLQLTA